MNHRLVSTIAALALVAACHHNDPNSTVYPTTASTSRGDGGGRRGGPGGPGGARADEALMRGITLSADQQQQVDAIRARYRSQMEQMRQQSGGDRTAMRDQMRTTMEKQTAEIRAVLTQDQQRQFDQNLAEIRARRPDNR